MAKVIAGCGDAMSGIPLKIHHRTLICDLGVYSRFHRTFGGSRYSVIAKIKYTMRTSVPTNQAERPLVANRNAVSVEISTMTTAPGQNCRFIGVGPMT